jgi:formylglycine-generating enzyme required for sulfatase activity
MADKKQSPPRIFLCHASEDKPRVRTLYRQLKAAGYQPWLDKEDLLPGQKWWPAIKRIISNTDNLVVVCLSRHSTTKRGVVQQEIKRALDVLDQMPDEAIYLIPARLEACDVPERLADLHWVDLFEEDGFEKLTQALDYELSQRSVPVQTASRATKPKIASSPEPKGTPAPAPASSRKPKITVSPAPKQAPTSQPFEPEMIPIRAGEFLMGSDPKKDKHAEKDEQPQHSLYLPDYYIAKTPVTNAQYAAFVEATGHRLPDHWKNGQPPPDKQEHPVVRVNWHDAVDYCRWLSETTGKLYRLPTEAEWEKAARGTEGLIYPWGNRWDAKRCNSGEGGIGGTTPVGAYPQGASPYSLLVMAGNVWEWCATKWQKPYPYDVEEDEWSANYFKGTNVRVLRGGSWYYSRDFARCAFRVRYVPGIRFSSRGCRVACTTI